MMCRNDIGSITFLKLKCQRIWNSILLLEQNTITSCVAKWCHIFFSYHVPLHAIFNWYVAICFYNNITAFLQILWLCAAVK